jgi:hypothetical protein
MPNRTTCVPAMLAVLFIALTPRAGGAESAGDDCVAKPNSAAPQGSHWYYRVDRTANRRCWFLGPEGLKMRQAQSPKRLLSVTSTPQLNPQLNTDTGAEAAASESVANVSTSPFLSKGSPPTPQLNTDTGAEAAASELVANVSTFPSLSKGAPPSTNDDAAEHTTADNMSLNFGATAGVSANAAAVRPPEVTLGVRATAAAPAVDASISVWPELMLATGAGVLVLIGGVLLILHKLFGGVGIQKLAGKSKSRAQRGTKAIQPRKAPTPAPASNIAPGRQANFVRGPLARPRASSSVREPLNPAQPTNDLEKDLRWLVDRSRRRAA